MFINCLLIFLIRILETALNTYRTILIIKNNKKLAMLVAFFEILVWLTAMKKIITNNFNFNEGLFYALGFSLGTYLGMIFTDKLSLENIILSFEIDSNNDKVLKGLKSNNIHYNYLNITDDNGREKKQINVYTNTKNTKKIEQIIDKNIKINKVIYNQIKRV